MRKMDLRAQVCTSHQLHSLGMLVHGYRLHEEFKAAALTLGKYCDTNVISSSPALHTEHLSTYRSAKPRDGIPPLHRWKAACATPGCGPAQDIREGLVSPLVQPEVQEAQRPLSSRQE